MTEHKYTDEEVIKALECCDGTFAGCEQCPMRKCRHHCNIKQQALDLINRQKAEISALTSAVDNSTQEFLKLHDEYQEQKAEIERLTAEKDTLIKTYKACMVEAIKEFAEKLKKECLFDRGYEILQEGTIDHLVKEFTEE